MRSIRKLGKQVKRKHKSKRLGQKRQNPRKGILKTLM
jgi:hypothetical protein